MCDDNSGSTLCDKMVVDFLGSPYFVDAIYPGALTSLDSVGGYNYYMN